jgi:hypothetical protein
MRIFFEKRQHTGQALNVNTKTAIDSLEMEGLKKKATDYP